MVNAVTLAFAAPLIFGVWYPYPTIHVLEMGRTLCTILGIQFLLAVALPFLLIKTNKTKMDQKFKNNYKENKKSYENLAT